VIARFQEGKWEGIEVQPYKDNPGGWMSITKQVLSPEMEAAFQVRYYEMAPGGYSSFERHEHEHCVVVLRGIGKVRLDDGWHDLEPNDVVRVKGHQPHQFANRGPEPFGILCVVDKERDRPVHLQSDGTPATS
jgi:quercetin dioxygenase-like cupin family protein